MFRIVNERTAWWPVAFSGVTEDGSVVENRIELRFLLLDEDEFPGWISNLRAHVDGDSLIAGGSDGTVPVSAQAASILSPVVRDWRGVGSENGEPLPFNEAAFTSLLRVPNVAVAIGAAYVACRQAAPGVREGN